MSANAANHRTIDTLRQEIDTLDEELLALIEKRLDLAASIASAKSEDVTDEDSDELLLRPAREASIIARLDAMPVESQTYADLAWYEWAWKRASFLYDELFPAIEEHDYGGW